jgi:hypothetical protein
MIDALLLAVAFRQIATSDTGAKNREHAAKRGAVIVPATTAFLRWKEALKQVPPLVGEFVSSHMSPRDEDSMTEKK